MSLFKNKVNSIIGKTGNKFLLFHAFIYLKILRLCKNTSFAQRTMQTMLVSYSINWNQNINLQTKTKRIHNGEKKNLPHSYQVFDTQKASVTDFPLWSTLKKQKWQLKKKNKQSSHNKIMLSVSDASSTGYLPASEARYSMSHGLKEDPCTWAQHLKLVHRFHVLEQQPDQTRSLQNCKVNKMEKLITNLLRVSLCHQK